MNLNREKLKLLEDAFSSRGRVRILAVLCEYGELNLSEVARKTGLNSTSTVNHLKVLTEKGLVAERRFGRVKMYRLNLENPKTKLITDFLKNWFHKDP
ncbi:winged helix-turn-helix transcriptional regulator [Candidatus Bathyarchaeota archaeon]|nr:winged helix-turn-helix transcriptional regulator [Candidatus Bathyarchaeota archaeon]